MVSKNQRYNTTAIININTTAHPPPLLSCTSFASLSSDKLNDVPPVIPLRRNSSFNKE
jgi:hypothetical protein